MGNAIAQMYGTDLSDQEDADNNMYRMFVSLPAKPAAEVITQGVSKIHEEFSKFFRTKHFDDKSNNKGGPLTLWCGIHLSMFRIFLFSGH